MYVNPNMQSIMNSNEKLIYCVINVFFLLIVVDVIVVVVVVIVATPAVFA
jgi:type IV secretory pathway component VirB8